MKPLNRAQSWESVSGLSWLLGMLAISAAFVAAMWWIAPQMEELPGIAMGGAAVLVFTGGLIGLSMIPYRIRQKRGIEGQMRAPYRRYMLRFLPAMLGYVVLLLLAVWYAKQAQPTAALAVVIAIAPALPLLLAIRAIFLLPRGRTTNTSATASTASTPSPTGGTLAICTVSGLPRHVQRRSARRDVGRLPDLGDVHGVSALLAPQRQSIGRRT